MLEILGTELSLGQLLIAFAACYVAACLLLCLAACYLEMRHAANIARRAKRSARARQIARYLTNEYATCHAFLASAHPLTAQAYLNTQRATRAIRGF